MKIDINKIKKQEAYLQFELYRIINNYIEKIQKGILSRDVLDLLDRRARAKTATKGSTEKLNAKKGSLEC